MGMGLALVGLIVGALDVAAVRWFRRSDPGWRRRLLRVAFFTFGVLAISSIGSGDAAPPLMMDVANVGMVVSGVAIVVVQRRARLGGELVLDEARPREDGASRRVGAGWVSAIAVAASVTGLLVGSEVGRTRVDVDAIRGEGLEEGFAEGEEVGRAEGLEDGWALGRAEGLVTGERRGFVEGYPTGFDDAARGRDFCDSCDLAAARVLLFGEPTP